MGVDLALVLDLAILGLATWRVSSIVTVEDLFQWPRSKLGVVHDPSTGEVIGTTNSHIAYLASCLWCASVWVAMILWIIHLHWPVIIYIFAISALAIFFQSIVSRR